jgi:hypothetical protein
MSRIRSLHPGIFTDDAYMGLSLAARELVKGIWCEADDQGVFEWKPLTLKARIMPADMVDIPVLLDELTAGKFIQKYECGGHSYGAVRNFRRFQRPKKPNASYLLPRELRTYVGLSADERKTIEAERTPVPHQFPTSPEKSPQMEDGGWRMEDVPLGVEGARTPPMHRGLQSAANWQPTEVHRQQAMLLGKTDIWLIDQAELYRDDCLDKGKLSEDHDAGFRKWLRRSPGFEPKGTRNGSNAQPAADLIRGFAAAARGNGSVGSETLDPLLDGSGADRGEEGAGRGLDRGPLRIPPGSGR